MYPILFINSCIKIPYLSIPKMLPRITLTPFWNNPITHTFILPIFDESTYCNRNLFYLPDSNGIYRKEPTINWRKKESNDFIKITTLKNIYILEKKMDSIIDIEIFLMKLIIFFSFKTINKSKNTEDFMYTCALTLDYTKYSLINKDIIDFYKTNSSKLNDKLKLFILILSCIHNWYDNIENLVSKNSSVDNTYTSGIKSFPEILELAKSSSTNIITLYDEYITKLEYGMWLNKSQIIFYFIVSKLFIKNNISDKGAKTINLPYNFSRNKKFIKNAIFKYSPRNSEIFIMKRDSLKFILYNNDSILNIPKILYENCIIYSNEDDDYNLKVVNENLPNYNMLI
jgi:hypothetical protein